ncbi:hypothetical protein [Chroococcidiopsis sp. SAG 2025]|uniref:hypothetical protein n=1 Tax=Chroococcidiopsis sp. SAG 2025 TaxID=171389 RepID=UPI0029371424|nr:hypothetical protein [Chroococcidiopsis sp. SAG 2025]
MESSFLSPCPLRPLIPTPYPSGTASPNGRGEERVPPCPQVSPILSSYGNLYYNS